MRIYGDGNNFRDRHTAGNVRKEIHYINESFLTYEDILRQVEDQVETKTENNQRVFIRKSDGKNVTNELKKYLDALYERERLTPERRRAVNNSRHENDFRTAMFL